MGQHTNEDGDKVTVSDTGRVIRHVISDSHDTSGSVSLAQKSPVVANIKPPQLDIDVPFTALITDSLVDNNIEIGVETDDESGKEDILVNNNNIGEAIMVADNVSVEAIIKADDVSVEGVVEADDVSVKTIVTNTNE